MNAEAAAIIIVALYFIVSDYYSSLSKTKAMSRGMSQSGGATEGKVGFNIIQFVIDNAEGLASYMVREGIELADDMLPEDWEGMSGASMEEIAPRVKGAIEAAEKVMQDPEIRKEVSEMIATAIDTAVSVLEQPATKRAIDNLIDSASKNAVKMTTAVSRTGTEMAMDGVSAAAGLVPFAGAVLETAEMVGTLANGAASVAASVVEPAVQATASGAEVATKAMKDTVAEQEKIAGSAAKIAERAQQVASS